MKAYPQLRGPLLTGTLASLACICSAGQVGRGLVINGQVATTDLRTINGRTYAPIADIAKALNMTLVSKPGSYRDGCGRRRESGWRYAGKARRTTFHR